MRNDFRAGCVPNGANAAQIESFFGILGSLANLMEQVSNYGSGALLKVSKQLPLLTFDHACPPVFF